MRAGFFGYLFRFKETFSRLDTTFQVFDPADLPLIVVVVECAACEHTILVGSESIVCRRKPAA